MVFLNASNYDYHFIIKELAKVFEREFNCLRENTETCNNKAKLKGLIDMENKLQKPYLTNYNLLTAQRLWQAQYQMSL